MKKLAASTKRTRTFDAIAGELCARVGLTYPPPAGTKYEVDAATWTEENEEHFRKWMMSYLLCCPGWKRMAKARLKKEIDWFMFQYSWKLGVER